MFDVRFTIRTKTPTDVLLNIVCIYIYIYTSGTHAQDHTLNVSNQNMGGIKSSREEEEEEEQEEEDGEGEEDGG